MSAWVKRCKRVGGWCKSTYSEVIKEERELDIKIEIALEFW